MRTLASLVVVGLAVGAGAVLTWRLLGPRVAAPPDPPAVVEKIREVARLETLDVTLYKKVSFAPDPASADSLWGDVAGWVRYTLRRPRGKAIVFAEAHVGLDARRLGPGSVALRGREALVVLPPTSVRVELRPGDTEVIDSNLDSAETAQLLERAKQAFQREVEADAALHQRAVASARRAVTALLLQAGLKRVTFVDALPGST